MKRIGICAGVLLVCSVFFAAANPSLDGRAVVAESGTFPAHGIYGKAAGYLPGDIVIVTNHATGFSIEVMILSSADASEGIAIVLSPEAAEKLKIVRGKDAYVKIQKRQPIAYEKAVRTENQNPVKTLSEDPDKNASKLMEQTPEIGKRVFDLARIKEEETAAAEQDSSAEVLSPQETAAAEEPNDEELLLAEVPEEVQEMLPADVAEAETEEQFVPADSDFPEEIALLDREIEAEIPHEDNSDAEVASETENVSEIPFLFEQDLPETAYADNGAAQNESEFAPDTEAPADEINVFEENISAEIAEAEEIPAVPAPFEAFAEEEKSAVSANTPSDIIETAVNPQPFIPAGDMIAVLEPAAENPPPADEAFSAYEKIIAELSSPSEPPAPDAAAEDDGTNQEDLFYAESSDNAPEQFAAAEKTAAEYTAEIKTENAVQVSEKPEYSVPIAAASDIGGADIGTDENSAPAEAAPRGKYDAITYSALSELQHDNYYVQIATMREESNIDSLVQKYGSNYPMNLVKVNGGRGYQVLVGPLNDDEYEVILARFRQRGFEDSFVRKIR
ncbi:MAG: SPOR domain-containing protein [Bacteroides sp.]|nr:SPOR domain-containing protein [Prevotella sp.]MCM1407234.1 SPOR domain-containing protein [Treponema brennaborense]MCM1469722.1 SPOR domain-containing protein [Bacteroides sp.]